MSARACVGLYYNVDIFSCHALARPRSNVAVPTAAASVGEREDELTTGAFSFAETLY